MNSTCFGGGIFYGCAALKAAPGITSWESCVHRKQISEKKAAGRRIDAEGIMWWEYLQSPGRRAVDFCKSSRGLKWQEVWSLLMHPKDSAWTRQWKWKHCENCCCRQKEEGQKGSQDSISLVAVAPGARFWFPEFQRMMCEAEGPCPFSILPASMELWRCTLWSSFCVPKAFKLI